MYIYISYVYVRIYIYIATSKRNPKVFPGWFVDDVFFMIFQVSSLFRIFLRVVMLHS